MILAGNLEGQVNVNLFEFVNSDWFYNRIHRFIDSMCECFTNTSNPSPEAAQYMKAAKEIMRTSAVTKGYYQWANANFERFIEDYKGYINKEYGKDPNYVCYSEDGIKSVHRMVVKHILPRWLDFRLGRPTTIWHINNTDPIESYDIEAIKERYGIGKKHYTEEQEKIALERKAAKRAARESNGPTGLNDHPNIPGIRALSPQDLELF